MKSLSWFRMYSEFLTDPVIKLLAFEDRAHFVSALCMKSMGVLDKSYPTPELRKRVISSLVGLSSVSGAPGELPAIDQARDRLMAVGLIDEDWQPLNWNKRQFQSDSSTERTRRWRETSQQRHGDALEQSRYRAEQSRAEGVTPPPGLDWESFSKWERYRSQIGKPLAPASLFAAQRKLVAFGKDQAAVVEQSIANGWHGLFHLKTERGSTKSTWVPPKSIAELEAEEAARGR